ncbi:MAG TPA: hypothetical protein VII72_08915 [Myxococcota bacterium]|jgi:uncharacterized protein involved in exopolysaccharide biosynthesis
MSEYRRLPAAIRASDRGLPRAPDPRFASARDFAYVIFKYRRMILAVFLATTLTVFAALSAMSNKFDAKSMLLVQIGQENAGVPVTVVNESFLQSGVRTEHVNSEIAALTSELIVRETVEEIGYERFLADGPPPATLVQWVKHLARGAYRMVRNGYEGVLHALGLRARLSDEQAVIALVRGNLVANPVKGSHTIVVALRLTNGELAADFVNALVQNHLERRIHYLGEAGANQLFRDLLAKRQSDLDAAETALLAFRSTSGISAMEEQRRIALDRARELDSRIDQAEAAVAHSEAEVGALRARLKQVPEGISSESTQSDPVGAELAGSLATLYQKRARLLSHYLPDSRFVREVEDEIAAVEKQMAAEKTGSYGSTTVAINPNRQSIARQIILAEAAREGIQAELKELRGDAAQVGRRLDQLDADEARSRALGRERTLAEESLLSLSKKIEETQVLEQMGKAQMTNLVVLSPATPPAEPSSPRRMLIMGAGLLGGLIAGLALAFASDAVDRSVRYGGDLERMGIPVLASVSLLEGPLVPSQRLFAENPDAVRRRVPRAPGD